MGDGQWRDSSHRNEPAAAESVGSGKRGAGQRPRAPRGIEPALCWITWLQLIALGLLGCDTNVQRDNEFDPRSDNYPPEGIVHVSASVLGNQTPCDGTSLDITIQDVLSGRSTICGQYQGQPGLYECRENLAPGNYRLTVDHLEGHCVLSQRSIVLSSINLSDDETCDSDTDCHSNSDQFDRRRIACPPPMSGAGGGGLRYAPGCQPIEVSLTPNGRRVEVCTGLTGLDLEEPPLNIRRLSETPNTTGLLALQDELAQTWSSLRGCSIAWFPTGDYALTLASRDHLRETIRLNVRPAKHDDEPDTTLSVEFESTRDGGSISGSVRLGQPPPGSMPPTPGDVNSPPVHLTIESTDNVEPLEIQRMNRSLQDSWRPLPDGTFGILVPSGTYTLSASAEGYLTQSRTIVIDAATGQTKHSVALNLVADGAYVAGRALRAVAADTFGTSTSPDLVELTLWAMDSTTDESSEGPSAHSMDEVVAEGWEPSSGEFKVWLRSGSYRLDVAAPGYATQLRTFQVAAGTDLALGEVIAQDLEAPVAPLISLERDLVNRSSILVDLLHPEAGVRLEAIRSVAQAISDVVSTTNVSASTSANGTSTKLRVELTEGDGEKSVAVHAIDRAGNRSALTTASVMVDTTPPEPGELILAGGAPEIRRRQVDAELRTSNDVVGFSYRAVMSSTHKADGCPNDQTMVPVRQVTEIELARHPGPQVACWRVWDEAGNSSAGPPVEILLGPYHPRPRPWLDEIAPEQLIATVSAPRVLRLTGGGIASDTVVDIGAQLSLQCRPSEPVSNCRASEEYDSCAGECLVDLPDEVRLAPALYPVTLRTPDPVIDGSGISNVLWLRVIAPRPLIDMVEPQGFAVVPGGPAEVDIIIKGRNILPTASIRLNNALPIALERIEREAQDAASSVELVATFDVSGIEPSNHAVQTLTIENPEGIAISIPFGVVNTFPCEGNVACRIRPRRSYPSSFPGHVRIEATLPNEGRSDYYSVDGASAWTLLGPDGSVIMGRRTPHGASRLRLPSPMPSARLVAHVPIASSKTVSIIPGEFTDEEASCEEVTRDLLDEAPIPTRYHHADLNLDGQSDLLFVSPENGSLHTSLSPPTWLGGSPVKVTSGDINGDGLVDAVTGHRATGRLLVHFGLGDGRFADSVALPLPESGALNLFNDIVVTDLDGDRRPDIVAAYGLAGGGAIVRWEAYPDGRFSEPEVLRESGDVLLMQVHEMNRPGIPELFAFELTESGGQGIRRTIYNWSSDGPGFTVVDTVPVSTPVEWLRLVGRDRTGTAHLWWHESGSTQIRKALRAPPGMWQRSDPYNPNREAPTALLAPNIVDLNGDGRPSVVAVAESDENNEDGSHDILLFPLRGDTELVGNSAVLPPDKGALNLTTDLEIGLCQWGNLNGRWRARYTRQSCTHPIGPLDPVAKPPAIDLDAPLRRGRHIWLDIDRDGVDDLVEQGVHLTSRTGSHCDRAGCQEALPRVGEWSTISADFGSRRALGGEAQLLLGSGSQFPDAQQRGWVERATMLSDGSLAHIDETSVKLPEIPRSIHPLRMPSGAALAVQGDRSIYIITALGDEPEVTTLRHPRDEPPEHMAVANLIQTEAEAQHDEIIIDVEGGLYIWSYEAEGWSGAPLLTWRIPGGWLFSPAGPWVFADLDGDEVDELIFAQRWEDPHQAVISILKNSPNDENLLSRHMGSRQLVGGIMQGPFTLHVADVNIDGVPDVLVGEPGRDLQVLLGSRDATLSTPLSLEFCNGEFADPNNIEPETVTIGTPDLNGDGYPEIVLSAGNQQCVRPLVADAGNVLSSVLAIDPPSSEDGAVLARLSHAGAAIDSVTLLISFDDEVTDISAQLTDPRGITADLEPASSQGKVLSWSSEGDSRSLSRVLGRQPRGEWTVEVFRNTPDGQPAGEPLPAVRSIELLVGVRWRTRLKQPDDLQCAEEALFACDDSPLLRPRGPEGDCDADGIPDISDPCDNQAHWPYRADMGCDRPTHEDCEACEDCAPE